MTAPSMITVSVTGLSYWYSEWCITHAKRSLLLPKCTCSLPQKMLVDKPDFHGEKVFKVSFSCPDLTSNVQLWKQFYITFYMGRLPQLAFADTSLDSVKQLEFVTVNNIIYCFWSSNKMLFWNCSFLILSALLITLAATWSGIFLLYKGQ